MFTRCAASHSSTVRTSISLCPASTPIHRSLRDKRGMERRGLEGLPAQFCLGILTIFHH